MKLHYLLSFWATLLLFWLALTPSTQAQKIFYVTTTGTATPTSASTTQASPSWVVSTTDLQGAINATTDGDQVWIAGGLYKPASSLAMKNGVAIYGGFVGSESSLSARPVINPVNGNPSSTTISGDGNKRVFHNPGGLTSSAVLDGVVITGGSSSDGGGMYNDNSHPTLTNCGFLSNTATGANNNYGGAMYNVGSNPTLTNCSFQNNQATVGIVNYGGAIYNDNSNPTLTNCSFLSNQATDGIGNYGGAIYNAGSNATLTNCSFQSNQTTDGVGNYGGAIYNDNSNASLTNCSFLNNQASWGSSNRGGAIYNKSGTPTLTNCSFLNNQTTAGSGGRNFGGAIYNNGSHPILTNCAFLNNQAKGEWNTSNYGGAIYNLGSHPSLINCSFQGNQATGGILSESDGGALYNIDGSNPTLANCILWDNAAGDPGAANSILNQNNSSVSATYSLFDQSVTNYTSDPSNLTTITSPFASTASVALATCSQAVNAGNPDSQTAASSPYSVSALPQTDLVGQSRIFGAGTPVGRVDMGAIELQGVQNPTRLYVSASQTATNGGDGLSWQTAFRDLQSALTYPTCSQSLTEIWVAGGLYKPGNSLAMRNGVAIYGGFVGNETALSARPIINPINGNPSSTTISGDGNKRVFFHPSSLSLTNSAVLDGVVITGGRSNQGGGMYNDGSSPTLRNCLFQGNQTLGGSPNFGGAMANYNGSNPTLTNCSFESNQATGGSQTTGGAIYNNTSNPILTNCSFLNNGAIGGIYNFGGAMFNDSSHPTLTNCSFLGNKTTGGNLGYGGVIYNQGSSPILTNCSLQENQATGSDFNVGGAFYNTVNSSPRLINCILWNNTIGVQGGSVPIRDVLGSTTTVRYSLFDASVTGYTSDPTNLTTATSPFVSITSVAPNACSPAINAGDPNSQTAATEPYSATALPATDLAGNPRIVSTRVDMGAMELQLNQYPARLYVATSSTAVSPDGLSWQTAFRDLQQALNYSCLGNLTEIWVAAGTYKPTASTTDRTASFVMLPRVKIYGGFVGTETTLSQRPAINPVTGNPSGSILNGDINNDNTYNGNSHHLVYNTNPLIDHTARLDGFVITGGNATGGTIENGGGVYNAGSNPTLANCSFMGNRALNGGGVYNGNHTFPTKFINCFFGGNVATAAGGGMYNERNNPELTACFFQTNSAHNGGAIANLDFSSPILLSCGFLDNSALIWGGVVFNKNQSNPSIINGSFQRSTSYGGTAIANEDNSAVVAVNSIFFNNEASNAFSNATGSNITTANCLFELGVTGYADTGGSFTLATSPFVSVNSLVPLNCSPIVNAGRPDHTTAVVGTADLAGNPRIVGGTVDIGAYEIQTPSLPLAFTQQPPTAASVCVGSPLSVPVSVSGIGPAYQWFRNGSPVGSQTAAALSIPSATTAHSGTYVVVVTNACSSLTSNAYQLAVNGTLATRLYVAASSTATSPDGLSWDTAFPDLQQALNLPCAQNLTEIWVASGTYKPTVTNNRGASFAMKNGVAIYGGFVGNETVLGQRPVVDPTSGNPSSSTLSGEIGNANTTGDNSYHVVYAATGLTGNAVLDGFVITGGNANEANLPSTRRGGGIYTEAAGLGQVTSPTFRQCLLRGNGASEGGGFFNTGGGGATSNPELIRCVLEGNGATYGGGFYNHVNFGGTGRPTLTDCLIRNNAAQQGGGFYNEVYAATSSGPVLTNCVVQGNRADEGGAMYTFTVGGEANALLTNCTLLNNSATTGGSAFYNFGAFGGNGQGSSRPVLTNAIVWGHGSSGVVNSGAAASLAPRYSLFDNAGGFDLSGPGNGTATTSPFMSATSVALAVGSPAINAGNPASVTVANGPYAETTLPALDLVGNPRIVAARVDMGAVESQGVDVLPISFTLTVLGSPTVTCAASPTLTLSGSETAVSYQLRRDGVNSGPAVSGTGNALSFGPQSLSGTFMVLATSTLTSLTTLMSGAVLVSSNGVPPSLTLTPASATLTCAQTSLTLTATASTTALQWSHGPTNTSALTVGQTGSYWVTATAPNGCSITSNTIVVSQNITPPSLTLNAGNGTLTCLNPSLTLVAQTNASSFTWTGSSGPLGNGNTLTVNASGSYTVTVTGTNGCTTSASTSAVSNTGLVATLTASNTGLCAGGSALLTASGGTNYRFTGPGGLSQTGPSPTLSATQTGAYSVTVTGANGCSATQSLSLTVSAGPTAQLTYLNGGRTVQVTGGNSYQLVQPIDRINGYEIRQTDANTNGVFEMKRPGPFWVIVTSANGCSTRVDGVSQQP